MVKKVTNSTKKTKKEKKLKEITKKTDNIVSVEHLNIDAIGKYPSECEFCVNEAFKCGCKNINHSYFKSFISKMLKLFKK